MISDWHADPAVLAGAAVALGLFAQAFLRLRRRGRASWGRAALFTAGVLVLVLALVSPIDTAAERSLLSAHMLQHALLIDVGPLLLLLALRGPLLFFLLPPAALRPLARLRPPRVVLRFLLRPRWSFVAWTLVLLAWHVPAAYTFALEHPWAHDLEHASFLAVGLLVWSQLLDPARRRALTPTRRGLYAVGLIATGHALLHPVFFSSGPLYHYYVAIPDRLFGLSALADQHLAAWTMTADQLLTLGVFALLALWPRSATSRARRKPASHATSSVAGGRSSSA